MPDFSKVTPEEWDAATAATRARRPELRTWLDSDEADEMRARVRNLLDAVQAKEAKIIELQAVIRRVADCWDGRFVDGGHVYIDAATWDAIKASYPHPPTMGAEQ